jgi:hypothetical protein
MIFIKNDFKQLFHLHLLIKYLITFNSFIYISVSTFIIIYSLFF